jgi:hypothetical protein
MRTTVTLEPDVEHYIREACHKRKASFKRVLNDTLREALKPPSPAPSLLPPKSMGLAPGIDPGKLNALADELEVEGFLEAESKRRHGNRPADP